MKRAYFFVAALILAVTMGFAQTNTNNVNAGKDAKNDKNAAEITFKSGITHDFGTVARGSDISFDFVFKNTGKVDLVLTDVQTSCGCTVPTWPKEPVKRKTENKISVKYDSNRIGHFEKTITVRSNAKNGDVVLTIKGTVQQ